MLPQYTNFYKKKIRMGKIYTALGLMSGTSGDGVDASIIKSDGNTNYEVIFDRYYKFTDEIYKEFHSIKKAQDDRNDYERFFFGV